MRRWKHRGTLERCCCAAEPGFRRGAPGGAPGFPGIISPGSHAAWAAADGWRVSPCECGQAEKRCHFSAASRRGFAFRLISARQHPWLLTNTDDLPASSPRVRGADKDRRAYGQAEKDKTPKSRSSARDP